MARCAHCRFFILAGGIHENGLRFCSDRCRTSAFRNVALADIDPDELDRYVWAVHQGACPVCRGPGPVDIHSSYWIWSAILLTSFKTEQRLSCRKCGRNQQFVGLISSMLLGWWGLPFGVIMTPVQIAMNLGSILGGPPRDRPSKALTEYARGEAGTQAFAAQRQAVEEASTGLPAEQT